MHSLPVSRRTLLLAAAGAAAVPTWAACAPARRPNEIVVWVKSGSSDMMESLGILAETYQQRNPGKLVRLVTVQSRGDDDATLLITAIRGNTAPDVFLGDRFTFAQFGSRGLLQDLSPLLAGEDADLLGDFLPFTVNEAAYNGAVYGIPFDTDSRGLYFNKGLLRDSGVDPAVLDPARGAPTFDQVWEIADKVSRTDAAGSYTHLGFIPWEEQAWPFTWCLANDAVIFDEASCRIAVDDPGFRQVYADYRDWARRLDYPKVDAFVATYKPPNAPPSQSPFFNDRLATSVVFSNFIFNLKKYAPKLDWGVTYLPVRADGDEPYSWSGGSGFTIPTGAANVEDAWEFIKFMTSPQGQAVWVQRQNYLPTRTAMLSDESLIADQRFFADLLIGGYGHSRPPLPVGPALWEAMNTAREGVLLGQSGPDEAMAEIARRVQPELDQYCPVSPGLGR